MKNILFILVFFSWSIFAGTLSCATSTAAACTGGTNVIVLRMSGSTNAHAELASQSTAAYASDVICCSGVSGLTTTCSGTFVTALKLSGLTNAHVELGTQTNYANSVCLQAPSGGSIAVSYGASCTGYDTTLASMSATTTNAHIGNASAYANKICATASGGGSLTIDIVDAGGVTVSSPSVAMNTTTLMLGYQITTGILGTSSEKIRADNSSGNAQWAASIAATSGTTAFWSAGTPKYDFNDPTANAGDGGDSDSYGGRLSVDPFGGTLTPKSGCTNTGVSKGSSAGFSEGTTDSITLLTAGSTAGTSCYWDLTGVALSQTIPAEQAFASYTLSMTLSIVAV